MPPTLAALRLDRLGDVIMALPVWQALKERYPNCRTAAVVSDYTAPLLVGLDYIDEVYTLKEMDFQGLEGAGRWLAELDCRAAVVLEPSFRIGLIPLFAGVPVRVGCANRPQALLANRWVYQRRTASGLHEVDLNLAMLRPLGVYRRGLIPRLQVSEEERAQALSKLKELLGGRSKPFVVVHPGSGGSAIDWPEEHFSELARRISERVAVVVSGRDSDPVQEVSRRAGVAAWPQGNLREFIALLACADALVSIDTGPMHIASALGTPTVSIFSPLRSVSPRRWAPRGNLSVVLKPGVVECERCLRDRCERYPCTKEVSVGEVVEAVESIPGKSG